MVVMCRHEKQIADSVAKVYKWIDSQNKPDTNPCKACGKCCDFQTYDHKLFVTSCELVYFTEKLKNKPPKPMISGRCLYNIAGACSVYPHRFAGCRIFFCKGDANLQSILSETAIKKFKSICRQFDLPYRYMNLAEGLNRLLLPLQAQ